MFNREALKKIKPLYLSYSFYKYLHFQLQLFAANINDWQENRKGEEELPLPPARLRHRVHGTLERESFIGVGKLLTKNISELCEKENRTLFSFENILDFGCGSGRVIRNFRDIPESCKIYGTDIDAELINWCQKRLPTAVWSVNDHRPPLSFADNFFDLIYSISVFTHLDEEFQHAWLKELQRITKSRALLILTVHGEHCFGQLPPAQREKIHSEGFMFITGATGWLKTDKLPDFYQTAYHTKEYIYKTWDKYFEIVRYVERGISDYQDAVILRRR